MQVSTFDELTGAGCTVPRTMRRVFVMSLIGLMLAFGIFYAFSWPSTLEGTRGNPVTLSDVKPEELIHVGLGSFRIGGRRPVKVVTVKLNRASPEIQLVAARVFVADNGKESIGVLRGAQDGVDSLPRAPGYVLNDTDAGGFVVTFTVSAPGRFTLDGFEVTYQTGWLTRTVRLGPDIVIDAPGPIASPTPRPSG